MARNEQKQLLQIQVSPALKTAIQAAALEADLSVATFCRWVLADEIGYTETVTAKENVRARAK